MSNNIEQHYDSVYSTKDRKLVFSLKPDIDPNSEKGQLLLDLMPMVEEASVRGLLNQTNIADVLGLGESRSLLDTITTGSAEPVVIVSKSDLLSPKPSTSAMLV